MFPKKTPPSSGQTPFFSPAGEAAYGGENSLPPVSGAGAGGAIGVSPKTIRAWPPAGAQARQIGPDDEDTSHTLAPSHPEPGADPFRDPRDGSKHRDPALLAECFRIASLRPGGEKSV